MPRTAPRIRRISATRMERAEASNIAMKVRMALVHHLPKGFPTNLKNACALGSYALMRVLEHHRAPAVFMFGEWDTGLFDRYSPVLCQHCWVELHGWIYDLTATQFGVADEVLVVRRSDPRYYECHAAGRDALAWINKHWMLSPRRWRRTVENVISAATPRSRAAT